MILTQISVHFFHVPVFKIYLVNIVDLNIILNNINYNIESKTSNSWKG